MKKQMIIYASLFALFSCSEGIFESPDLTSENVQTEFVQEETDSVIVNATEIGKVVECFFGEAPSRAVNYAIETIVGKEGEDLIYVVNYGNDEGFVLISATKNVEPVLAYNTKGHFSINGDKHDGLKDWLSDAETLIENSDKLTQEEKRINRLRWRRFEQKNQSRHQVESRVGPEDLPDNYYELEPIVTSKRMELESKGYLVFDVTGEISRDPQLDAEIADYAKGAIHPAYESVWDKLSFVSIYPYPQTNIKYPNFVKTVWHQEYPFNEFFPNVLPNKKAYVGCGVLAVGQVMKYYEYPISYDWANMPLINATSTTSSFLYDVAINCKASYKVDGTGTSIDNCCNALHSYGYNARVGNHSFFDAFSNVGGGKPVIMTGYKSDGTGHAWICSGGEYSTYQEQYVVWTFTTSTKFTDARTFFKGPGYNSQYLYMNWGWNGIDDGFYSSLAKPSIAYNDNRKNIYDIEPIK